METLAFVIKNQKPTVSLLELKKYEAIRKDIEEENEEVEKQTIGFKKYS